MGLTRESQSTVDFEHTDPRTKGHLRDSYPGLCVQNSRLPLFKSLVSKLWLLLYLDLIPRNQYGQDSNAFRF